MSLKIAHLKLSSERTKIKIKQKDNEGSLKYLWDTLISASLEFQKEKRGRKRQKVKNLDIQVHEVSRPSQNYYPNLLQDTLISNIKDKEIKLKAARETHILSYQGILISHWESKMIYKKC